MSGRKLFSLLLLFMLANAQWMSAATTMTANDFFSNSISKTDNDITITGTYNPGASYTFTNFNSATLTISQSLIKRNAQRSMIFFGNAASFGKTININIASNYNTANSVFEAISSGNGATIANMVFAPNIRIDTSAYTGNALNIINLRTPDYGLPGGKEYKDWPTSTNISFGGDVVVTNLSGTGKFIKMDLPYNNQAVGVVFLNHKGAQSNSNTNQNYYGETLPNTWVGRMANTYMGYFGTNFTLSNNNFDSFVHSGMGKLLQISGDIYTNSGGTTENARIYANFVNRGNEIAYYYGDMSGNGKIFASFVGADFKGNNNAGAVGTGTGSITGNGERYLHFVFRNGTQAPKEQFDVTINSYNNKNRIIIDNFQAAPIVLNANGSYHNDTWKNLADAGLSINTANRQGTFVITRSSIEVAGGGALTGFRYGVFGNVAYENERDAWGYLIYNNPNYANLQSGAVRTIRKQGSTAPSVVSDADFGNDTNRRELYFVFAPNTFNGGANGISGYTGTITGGTDDSLYYFRNVGYIDYAQVANANGKVVLDIGSAYRDEIIGGNNNAAVNVALNLTAQNNLKQIGRIAGSSPTRRVEMDFTGMGSAANPHKDLNIYISGSGYDKNNANNGYYIYNLQNATSNVTPNPVENNEILKVLQNAGVSFNRAPAAGVDNSETYTAITPIPATTGAAPISAPTSSPLDSPNPNTTDFGATANVSGAPTDKFKMNPNTNTDPISEDSKFVFRGTSMGNINTDEYELDIVFDMRDSNRGKTQFGNDIEKSSFTGNNIDLIANGRGHKLHFYGDGAISANTRIRLGGIGSDKKSDIALIDTGKTNAVEIDARNMEGVISLQNAHVTNSKFNGNGKITLSIKDAKVSASGANAVAIESRGNTTIQMLSGTEVEVTGSGNLVGIKTQNQNLTTNGAISVTGGTPKGISHSQDSGNASVINRAGITLSTGGRGIDGTAQAGATLNITNYADIDAPGGVGIYASANGGRVNVSNSGAINGATNGIVASLNNGGSVGISSSVPLRATGKDIVINGTGSASVGTFITDLNDFSTNAAENPHNPADNGRAHVIQIDTGVALRFTDRIIFESMNSTESFYLQDLVAVGNGTTSASAISASWNPSGADEGGKVGVGGGFKIQGPAGSMYGFVLDRATGLVNVITMPDFSPSELVSKTMVGGLEASSNRLLNDVGLMQYSSSRNRYIDRSNDYSNTRQGATTGFHRLRTTLRGTHENRDLSTGGRVSNRIFVDHKSVDTLNPINYLLYEKKDRVEMFLNPYWLSSELKGKEIYGYTKGYGINGGVAVNVFRDTMVGWHVGIETRGGKSGTTSDVGDNDLSMLALSAGMNLRVNATHFGKNNLLYVRGGYTHQFMNVSQEALINSQTGGGNNVTSAEKVKLVGKTTASRIDALLGVESSLKNGDVVAFEGGVNYYQVNFGKMKFTSGDRESFSVDARKEKNIYLLGNLRWARMYRNQYVYLQPSLGVGVKILVSNNKLTIPVTFAGEDVSSTMSLNRFVGVADIGFDALLLNKSLTLGLRYVGEYGQYLINHTIQGKVGYRF